MRIAGARIDASVAHVLVEVLRTEGYPVTADKIVDALNRQITTEVALTLEDHQAILAALSQHCPPTLNRLRQRLLEEQRYVRRATGG
jgi:hypothetical protein